ncbi:hypothetical protein PoB_001347400 [Plakobranchus ocellatus]|uniref:Uncharacterized protein n=1 Tax=Plakobranchus ocellatus TaxID=259542 RepID=A0AAV3YV77_9GAST|nr:hypothetical protein PoB_001347400 [Plakobranchus ocellatus]
MNVPVAWCTRGPPVPRVNSRLSTDSMTIELRFLSGINRKNSTTCCMTTVDERSRRRLPWRQSLPGQADSRNWNSSPPPVSKMMGVPMASLAAVDGGNKLTGREEQVQTQLTGRNPPIASDG